MYDTTTAPTARPGTIEERRPGDLSRDTLTTAARSLLDLEDLAGAGDLTDPATLEDLETGQLEELRDLTGYHSGELEDLARAIEDEDPTNPARDALSVEVYLRAVLGMGRDPEVERVEVTTGLGGPNVWHVYRPGSEFVEVHAAWDGHHVAEVYAPEVAARVLILVEAFGYDV